MARKYLVPIDLNNNEIRNVLIHLLGSDPGSPLEGQLWYNSTTHRLKFRTNSASIDVTDALTLGGSTLANVLARANHTGTQLAATISDLAATVQAYRLDQFAVPTADVSFNSRKITSLADPVSANDAANKTYVDNLLAGLSWKQAVRIATAVAGTLASSFANGQTVDGVVLATGNRILIKNQAAPAENGIYTVNASGAPTRATDADTAAEILQAAIWVQEGTTNADSSWVLTTNAPITLGTTGLTFAQTSGGTTPTAGAGLTLTSNTYDLVAGNTPSSGGPGGGLVVAADSVAIDTGVVARRFAQDIGDNASVAIVVTHNLGTRDVIVMLRDNTTPWAYMEPDIEATSTNTVTLRFTTAPTNNQYRVIILG